MEKLLQYFEREGNVGRAFESTLYCTRGHQGDQWPPLHVAAMMKDLSMVRLLLEKGAFVLSQTGFGIQAIHLAARVGSMKVLVALIDAGADVNCADREGRQPLHYISESKDRPDIIRYLAERGASIDGFHRFNIPTPLDLARENNLNGNVKILPVLGYLADESSLALDNAIRVGSPASVEFSIRQGGDSTRCRSDGHTAFRTFVLIFYATTPRDRSADKIILRLLLDYIDLLATDKNGHTVFHTVVLLGTDKVGEVARFQLAELFLENLPEHKILEKNVMRSVLREQRPRTVGVPKGTPLISAALDNSSGLG